MTSLRLFARPAAVALAIGALSLPGQASALSLDEALRLAEREAPSLAAQAATVQAARSAAVPAGELPDPKLALGLSNLPIDGEDRWRLDRESMTMQSIGLMQDVPNRAKRRARVEVAEAAVAVAGLQERVTRQAVRQQTAQAWIAALAVERKLALFRQLYQENDLFARAVQARIAGGSGNTADSVLPRQEAALLAEQEDQLQSDLASARAALRRWIGAAASQPLSGAWPSWPYQASHYQGHLARHPELQLFDPMTREAEARVREAVADKRPDWGWGVEYQRREAFGDMLSLNPTFDLPVFAGSRQDPKIAAERARLNALDAERQATLRQHDAELEAELAELQRLERAVERLDNTLLPLAEEKVRLALADYRAGSGELIAVVQAREALVQTRLRQVDLNRDQALAHARLHFAFGDTP